MELEPSWGTKKAPNNQNRPFNELSDISACPVSSSMGSPATSVSDVWAKMPMNSDSFLRMHLFSLEVVIKLVKACGNDQLYITSIKNGDL